MDLSKLKLEKYSTYNSFNMPQEFHVSLEYSDTPDVYFVFVQSFEDLNRYTNHILNQYLHKDNRIFYVYPKGQKSFHRDHIVMYSKRSPFLIRKAPMLCSLSKDYSCFTFMIKK